MTLSWDLFKHYLLSRRAGALIRTVAWLCMAGVGLGVLSLVVVISVMNGFNDQIRRRLLAVEPHLVVQVPSVKSADALSALPLRQALAREPGVRVEVFERQDVILRTVDGLFGGAIARGVEPGTLRDLLEETRRSLSPAGAAYELPQITSESTSLAPGEVMMGIDLARGLGVFEGDTIVIIPPEALLLPAGEAPPFERVTVKGLLATNLPDVDSRVLFYGRGRSLLKFRESASLEVGFELRLPDPERFEPMKAKIESQGRPLGVKVESWVDRNSALFHSLRLEKIAMGVFLGLAALIASFSIVTVLVLLLTQKRKDIGLLMSLGLSPKKARDLFVGVGLILSFIGIGGGTVLGVILCGVIDRYPIPLLPDIYYDSTIPAKVDPVFVTGIFLLASAIAFVSAWIPARSTTREVPAEALRGAQAIKLGDRADG